MNGLGFMHFFVLPDLRGQGRGAMHSALQREGMESLKVITKQNMFLSRYIGEKMGHLMNLRKQVFRIQIVGSLSSPSFRGELYRGYCVTTK